MPTVSPLPTSVVRDVTAEIAIEEPEALESVGYECAVKGSSSLMISRKSPDVVPPSRPSVSRGKGKRLLQRSETERDFIRMNLKRLQLEKKKSAIEKKLARIESSLSGLYPSLI